MDTMSIAELLCALDGASTDYEFCCIRHSAGL